MDVPAAVPDADAGGRPAAGPPAAGAVQRPAVPVQVRLHLAVLAPRLPAVGRGLPAGPAVAAQRGVRANRARPAGDRASPGRAPAGPVGGDLRRPDGPVDAG